METETETKTKSGIQYSIRMSKKAKRLHIKINRLAQVEVVSPLKMAKREIEIFVNNNIIWIERHKNKILSEMEKDSIFPNIPPSEIHFPFLEKTYQVKYESVVKKEKFTVNYDEIIVYSETDDKRKSLLRKFIHELAKDHLTHLLNDISGEFKLPYNRVFIKAQKTRWGSCSSKKNINLNRNLVFLTKVQVEYLIVHELCHTIHLNHSLQYWRLVSEFIPSYKEIDKSLKNATKKIPLWAIS